MKKILSLFSAFALTVTCYAQQSWTQARQEIHDNILLSASNYTAYVDPSPSEKYTPTPKGYEPFYLSHYGRHGSRWLINDWEYMEVINVLNRAHDRGKLSARGEELREKITRFYKDTDARHRLGELTDVGEQQHHRIGKRLTEHFPEIFGAKNCQVDARSTVVIRCILSMTAECEELTRFNKNLRIHNDVSNAFQFYLNREPWEKRLTDARSEMWSKANFDFRKEYTHPERFWNSIMNDPNYRDEKLGSRGDVMRRTFDICANMQSHLKGISLWDFFTEEECYDQWRIRNVDWYVNYSRGLTPFSQANLLRNFLETADTCLIDENPESPLLPIMRDSSWGGGTHIAIDRNYRGATLRFGHEVVVMPMAALLELGDCYPEWPLDDLRNLDKKWANFRIFPMASNIQLIFYRPKKGKMVKLDDILVKALLNEHEMTMPGKPVSGCYYRWGELRQYYQEKLDKYLGITRLR
ncbi:MAG: histidine-type phosphatase [Bacteroidaceae bacterium]|nr:histidine-type phosphatase [Bacteroidaceae bacterium]